MQNIEPKKIRVSAGILFDQNHNVLLTKRLASQSWPEYWEFPGGKLETDESLEQCLKRELLEEININVIGASRWITREFNQDDKILQVTFFLIHKWIGEIKNKDVAEYKWIDPKNIEDWPEQILPKNLYILRALSLPPLYLITDAYENPEFHKKIKTSKREFFIQIREPKLEKDKLIKLELDLKKINRHILVNSRHVHELSSDFGIHFTESDLLKQTQLNLNKINSASAHSLQNIQYAQKLGISFVVLSQVFETKSHPLTKGMGWDAFKAIVNQVDIPVYALGGMDLEDLDDSYNNGAVGIASQRKIWDLLN